MARILFQGSKVSLIQQFWAIYFIGSDKGSIVELGLSKLIEVNQRTARLILKKLTTAMGHRDSLYQLSGTIELDDTLVGSRQKANRVEAQHGKRMY